MQNTRTTPNVPFRFFFFFTPPIFSFAQPARSIRTAAAPAASRALHAPLGSTPSRRAAPRPPRACVRPSAALCHCLFLSTPLMSRPVSAHVHTACAKGSFSTGNGASCQRTSIVRPPVQPYATIMLTHTSRHTLFFARARLVCPFNTYSVNTGSGSCNTCPAGTFTQAAGSNSSFNCICESTPACHRDLFSLSRDSWPHRSVVRGHSVHRRHHVPGHGRFLCWYVLTCLPRAAQTNTRTHT